MDQISGNNALSYRPAVRAEHEHEREGLLAEAMPLVAGMTNESFSEIQGKSIDDRVVALNKRDISHGKSLMEAAGVIITKTETVKKVTASDIKRIVDILYDIKEREDLPIDLRTKTASELYTPIGTFQINAKNLSEDEVFNNTIINEKKKGNLGGLNRLLGIKAINVFVKDLYDWAKRCDSAGVKVDQMERKSMEKGDFELKPVLRCPVPLIPPVGWESGTRNDEEAWLEGIFNFAISNLNLIKSTKKRIMGDDCYEGNTNDTADKIKEKKEARKIYNIASELSEKALLELGTMESLIEDLGMGCIHINTITESKEIKSHIAKCFSLIESQMKITLSPKDLREIKIDESENT